MSSNKGRSLILWMVIYVILMQTFSFAFCFALQCGKLSKISSNIYFVKCDGDNSSQHVRYATIYVLVGLCIVLLRQPQCFFI